MDGILKELDATASPVAAIQYCRIAFVPETMSVDTSGSDDTLEIPLYVDSQRHQLITSLPVRCPRDELNSWFRRGVILHLRNT